MGFPVFTETTPEVEKSKIEYPKSSKNNRHFLKTNEFTVRRAINKNCEQSPGSILFPKKPVESLIGESKLLDYEKHNKSKQNISSLFDFTKTIGQPRA